MDQNSTNGSGPDKRNWRERLGIGAKEMPKLSDEFRDGSEPSDQPRQPPAGVQQVPKPAPMAPRASRPPSPISDSPSAPPPPPPPAPPRVMPRTPDNAAQDALADKLRAQRAAAERLAEQRVQAARERAEGRTAAAEPPPLASPPPRAPAAPRNPPPPPPPPSRTPRATVAPPPPVARPKFSFAEDPPSGRGAAEPSPRSGLSGGPLNPPRTALGGERGQPPFLRPSPAGAPPRTSAPYRPADPAAASYGAPPRLQPPPGRPGYGGDAGAAGYTAPRAPQRRAPVLDPYPRAPERDFAESDKDDARPAPRLGRPARGRGSDDFDEVFEDDAGARPRASARDYQSAYGDGEDAFADDQRRSGGPWLLLMALLAAALVTGVVVWYFNTGAGSNVAGTGSSTGQVPVVSAPADPAKVAPDSSAAGTDEPAVKRKQIYDRIVGDQEVIGGQMQPTEEIPVQPGSAQPLNEVPAAAETNPIPAPDANSQGTGADGLPSVDEPPPLPLPPADQQGSISNSATQQIAATSAQPQQEAAAPPPLPEPEPEPSAMSSVSSADPAAPPPETATDGAAVVSAVPPELNAVAETEPPPPKKKLAEKKPVEDDLGSEPVVLVPPAQPASLDANMASSETLVVPDQPAAQAQKKPRSIMDLFRGEGGSNAAQAGGVQVAAVEPPAAAPAAPKPAAPAPQPAEAQPVASSGFLVQLSSFRSESEARREYTRLAGLYPNVVGGLPQRINQTSIGGSTRYQLGLGPLPSRGAATKVCSALITQGESDCIVRGR